MERINFTVNAGGRIDKVISLQLPEITRSAAAKLIENGGCTVEGKPVGKSYRAIPGETVELLIDDPEPIDAVPQNIPLDIVYEDSDLLVVNKPRGMVVHPAAGNYDGTLVNALLYHCGDSLSGINGKLRPGIVHRIDKDTSGLLIVAKNDFAHRGLAEQIKEHSFKREYEAVVHGVIKEPGGKIDAPIGRHSTNRKQMAVTDKSSRNAVTYYSVIKNYRNFCHVRLRLETGRTHQIRVHMAYIHHPVAGDPVYGPKKGVTELNGQCLHARVIGFIHPRSGEYLEFTSELPDYFIKFLDKLEKGASL